MDKNTHLQLVKDMDVQDVQFESRFDDKAAFELTDRMKIAVLFFIMGVLPLSAYQFGAGYWGTEIGTHIAVAVGAVCTLVTSTLIYFLGWMDEPDGT